LARRLDVLVLDCGAGISRNVISFALMADVCLLVTTPEPTALTDAYGLIKVLVQHKCRGSIRLLVNAAESRAEAQRVFARVLSVSERFLKHPIADGGYLLQDSHVEQAVRQRSPFVVRFPRCAASACMEAIASRFPGCPQEIRGGNDLVRRVVGLFA
jgi:flagellar biosynthesis protein FlhG